MLSISEENSELKKILESSPRKLGRVEGMQHVRNNMKEMLERMPALMQDRKHGGMPDE